MGMPEITWETCTDEKGRTEPASTRYTCEATKEEEAEKEAEKELARREKVLVMSIQSQYYNHKLKRTAKNNLLKKWTRINKNK